MMTAAGGKLQQRHELLELCFRDFQSVFNFDEAGTRIFIALFGLLEFQGSGLSLLQARQGNVQVFLCKGGVVFFNGKQLPPPN